MEQNEDRTRKWTETKSSKIVYKLGFWVPVEKSLMEKEYDYVTMSVGTFLG